VYPADYGFVPDTLGEDGDPLDALVLVLEPDVSRLPDPQPPDRHVPDDRREGPRRQESSACPPSDPPPRNICATSTTCPQFEQREIEHFFLIYKELEPGKSVEGASWADRAAAEAEVEASRLRLQATQQPTDG